MVQGKAAGQGTMEQDEEAGPIVVAEDDEWNDDQDANDPRQDIQHAKTITAKDIIAKDITAKDINGSYSYPLVGPRPEEAPDSDYSPVVQSTGTEVSPVHTLDVMNKPLYSQHLEDDERDDERHDDQDDIDPGQDIPHAKNVTAKTITAEDNTAKDCYSQRLEDNGQDDEQHDDQDAIDPRQDIRHDNNVTAVTSHLDLLLQLLVRSGLPLAHLGLGHPSVLSGIVLRYKDR